LIKNNSTPNLNSGLMTIAEFCDWGRISRTAVYREIWEGRLTALKRGRRTLIATSEAQRWLELLPHYAVSQVHSEDDRPKIGDPK
jgi:excisionase family DNA binding protein